MRKRLAGVLIRLAHRIYRPTVTDLTDQFDGTLILVGADGSRHRIAGPPMPPERRESRGWEFP